MIDDIIKLIDLSIENGTITDEEYKVIQMRALRSSIPEEEVKLIIQKRLKQHASQSGTSATIPPPELGTPLVSTNDDSFKEPNVTSKETRKRRIFPIVFAGLAIIFSFLDWISIYSSTKSDYYSGEYDIKYSAWHGGYGATILIIFLIGAFLWYKKNKFYWVTGIVAIIDAVYIYSTFSDINASFSYDLGEYGGRASSSAGYTLQYGFYLFIVVSVLFSISGLTSSYSNHDFEKKDNRSAFRRNLSASKLTLGLSFLCSIMILTLIISRQFGVIDSTLISIIMHIALIPILLIVYVFSPNILTASYVFLAVVVLIVVGLYFTYDPNKESVLYVVFPLLNLAITYLNIHRESWSSLIRTRRTSIILFLMISLLISCNNRQSNSTSASEIDSFSGDYVFVGEDVKYVIHVMGGSFEGYAENNFDQELFNFTGTVSGNNMDFDDGLNSTMTGVITNQSIQLSINTSGVISDYPIQITLYRS